MCLQSGLYKLERGLFWLFSSKQVLIENGWKVILPLKLCKLFFSGGEHALGRAAVGSSGCQPKDLSSVNGGRAHSQPGTNI